MNNLILYCKIIDIFLWFLFLLPMQTPLVTQQQYVIGLYWFVHYKIDLKRYQKDNEKCTFYDLHETVSPGHTIGWLLNYRNYWHYDNFFLFSFATRHQSVYLSVYKGRRAKTLINLINAGMKSANVAEKKYVFPSSEVKLFSATITSFVKSVKSYSEWRKDVSFSNYEVR